MRIAIIGPGAIGSTFAWRLAQAGHDVTVVARGARLRQLEQDQGVVLNTGQRAEVTVRSALDEAVPWDLVLVTVLATQVAAVLPALRRCAAARVMFMFNTFEPLQPLRDAVGAARFSFGFPAGVFTLLVDGRIHPQVRTGTTASDASIAKVFSEAGIPTAVERDMESWLRSHAALVVPLMAIGTLVLPRGNGVSWGEASAHARAFDAGLAIVRAGGNALIPGYLALLAKLPRLAFAALLWMLSRTRMLRDLGRLGPTEARMLVDMMKAAQPGLAGPLLVIRP
jgi:2-dehydropantoate 2-reductase